jgi:hypothetical protein
MEKSFCLTDSDPTPIFRVWRDPETHRIVGCLTDERENLEGEKDIFIKERKAEM